MEESILTEYVRADLEKIGFVTYAEVCVKGGGDKRADMFARVEDPLDEKYGQTIAFEAKLSFNIKVLEQAYFWKNRAHMVYIIVPTSKKNMSSRKFARELCKQIGIGVMEVNLAREQYHITVQSATCANPTIPELYQEQRMVIASNSNNEFMTPFKRTVMRINEFFADRQFSYITELVKGIDHHYKSDIQAAKAIKILIENRVVKGFYIIKKNHKIVIGKITLDKAGSSDDIPEAE